MATKSKHRKNHKQKVAARNQRLKEQKARNDKFQREFIMNLIKQEQEKGLFENAQPVTTTDGPVIDGPVIDNVVDTTVEAVDVKEESEEKN